MRYRPFRASAVSISAIALDPTDPAIKPAAREALFRAALDLGVNAFELNGSDAAAQDALGEMIGGFERSLLVVSLRVGSAAGFKGAVVRDFAPAKVMGSVEQAVARLGVGALDVLTLDGPSVADLTPELVEALREGHGAGLYRNLGVRAEGAAADALVRCGAFKVLQTRFNLLSGWPERNLIRAAIERGMTVVGYGYLGGEGRAAEPAAEPKSKSLFSLGRKRSAPAALARAHGYGFLNQTQNWSNEQICLTFALTEPSLAAVQVAPDSVEQLTAMAATPERDLPTGLAAQIEMARFSAVA